VDNINWKGWLISIAWSQISNKPHSRRAKNYFPLQNHVSSDCTKDAKEQNRQWLRNKLRICERMKNSNINLHHELWKDIEGVQVLQGQFFENQCGLPESIIVVVVLCNSNNERPHRPFFENGIWQLCLLVSKTESSNGEWDGAIYARHGSDTGPSWWTQTSKKTPFFYKSKEPPLQNMLLNLQICVYV
jgi:hypothetical protein